MSMHNGLKSILNLNTQKIFFRKLDISTAISEEKKTKNAHSERISKHYARGLDQGQKIGDSSESGETFCSENRSWL